MNLSKVVLLLISVVSIYSCSSTDVVSKSKNIESQFALVKPVKMDFSTPKGLSANIGSEISEKKYELINKLESSEKIAKTVEKSDLVLQQAKTYLGTPYRYGGTTRRGIDCSAFVQKSFSALNIELPRVASAQSTKGEIIPLSEVKKGDLLFFAQSGNRISHVAIVERVDESGEIYFIHSATSKGVSIAPLSDAYWSRRYRKAKRII